MTPFWVATASLILLAWSCSSKAPSPTDTLPTDVEAEVSDIEDIEDTTPDSKEDIEDTTPEIVDPPDTAPGDADTPKPPSDVSDVGPDTAECIPTSGFTNPMVYDGLVATCIGCHDAGWPQPLFASLSAFETLVVNNFKTVVPGKPTEGSLLALLKGEANGTLSQMPIGGPSFLELEADGKTDITVANIEAWIAGLGECEIPFPPPAEEPTDGVLVQRLKAEHIVTALEDHLALEDGDFYGSELTYGYYPVLGYGSKHNYPVRSPDAYPGWGTNSPLRVPAIQRFLALGGPDWGELRRRSQEISPVFVQSLIQTAQAQCRVSIDKTGNTAVLGALSLSDTSATNEAGIKANIAKLYLKIIGEPASPETVDGLMNDVFQVYETLSGTEEAWVAVCSTLLRHPLFLTY